MGALRSDTNKASTANLACFVALVGGLLVLWPQGTWGQQVSGTIAGYVTDQSGSVVPGASVTATNILTGVAAKRSTEPSGLYAFTNLIPGTYMVEVEAPGFQKFVQKDIVLTVDSKITVDAQMTLGAVSQEVTITAAPSALKMEKADVSTVISERAIEREPVGASVPWSHAVCLSTGPLRKPEPRNHGGGQRPILGIERVPDRRHH